MCAALSRMRCSLLSPQVCLRCGHCGPRTSDALTCMPADQPRQLGLTGPAGILKLVPLQMMCKPSCRCRAVTWKPSSRAPWCFPRWRRRWMPATMQVGGAAPGLVLVKMLLLVSNRHCRTAQEALIFGLYSCHAPLRCHPFRFQFMFCISAA